MQLNQLFIRFFVIYAKIPLFLEHFGKSFFLIYAKIPLFLEHFEKLSFLIYAKIPLFLEHFGKLLQLSIKQYLSLLFPKTYS